MVSPRFFFDHPKRLLRASSSSDDDDDDEIMALFGNKNDTNNNSSGKKSSLSPARRLVWLVHHQSVGGNGDYCVVMAVRNPSKAEEKAREFGFPTDAYHVMECELADLDSVRSFAKTFLVVQVRPELFRVNL